MTDWDSAFHEVKPQLSVPSQSLPPQLVYQVLLNSHFISNISNGATVGISVPSVKVTIVSNVGEES